MRPQTASHYRAESTGRGYKPRVEHDSEMCAFCGDPATEWPVFTLPPLRGELPLREPYVVVMCGTCYEDCEELKERKGKQLHHGGMYQK